MTWDLIADIGGTNARFATVVDGDISNIQSYPTKGGDDLDDHIATYIGQMPSKPDRVVLAAAGIITDGSVTLTNAKKTITSDDVKRITSARQITFINDFAAAAWALATATLDDVETLQGSPTLVTGNRVILGPGTGLGVGTLGYNTRHGYFAQPGEGGHVGVSPRTSEDIPIFEALQHIWPAAQIGQDTLRFEAEAILSGTGIPYIYKAVCTAHGVASDLDNPRDILNAGHRGETPQAQKAVEMFQTYLGMVAGDLALFISAHGGVFICGGVVLKNQWLLNDRFIDAFNDGGRFTNARKSFPIHLYKNKQFGLIGAANALATI